jgi:hypothetical protein
MRKGIRMLSPCDDSIFNGEDGAMMTDSDLNDTLIAQLSREVQRTRIENRELAAALAELTAERRQLIEESHRLEIGLQVFRSTLLSASAKLSTVPDLGNEIRIDAEDSMLRWCLKTLDECLSDGEVPSVKP